MGLPAECDDTDFAAFPVQKLWSHCRLHFTNEGRLMRISRFRARMNTKASITASTAIWYRSNRAVQRGRLMLLCAS